MTTETKSYWRDDDTEYQVPLHTPRPGQSITELAAELGGKIPPRSRRRAACLSGQVIAAVTEDDGFTWPVVPR